MGNSIVARSWTVVVLIPVSLFHVETPLYRSPLGPLAQGTVKSSSFAEWALADFRQGGQMSPLSARAPSLSTVQRTPGQT